MFINSACRPLQNYNLTFLLKTWDVSTIYRISTDSAKVARIVYGKTELIFYSIGGLHMEAVKFNDIYLLSFVTKTTIGLSTVCQRNEQIARQKQSAVILE